MAGRASERFSLDISLRRGEWTVMLRAGMSHDDELLLISWGCTFDLDWFHGRLKKQFYMGQAKSYFPFIV